MPALLEESAQQRERRRRVVGVAMTMAADGGYEAVQMRRVAEESGVALGTIYRYFNSKDELLLAGLAGWIDSVRDELLASPPVGATAADRLAMVLEEASRRTEAVPVLMKALVTALASTGPDLGRYRDEIEAGWYSIVRHAIGDTAVDETIDVESVQRIVGHVWFSAITRWVTGQTDDGSVGEELSFVSRALLA